MKREISAWILIGVFLVLSGALLAGAQEPEDPEPRAVAGPIEFHVVPELGAGVLLRDDQTINLSGTDGYFVVRLPGLIFPNWNGTTTGIQVEFSRVPGVEAGIRYDILSYTRTKIAGPAYTGANIRIARGTSREGAELSGRVMPIVGLRILTIAERVPVSIELELLDQDRPIKAAVYITWQ